MGQRHHRNPGRHERLNDIGLIGSSFKLDRLAPSFLENPAGGHHRLEYTLVINRKRQIDNDQSPFRSSANHLGVIDHFVESHRKRILMTLHDHRHAVPHQEHIDSGSVERYSWMFLVGSTIAFVVHLPLLDRAERKRKEFLTGGSTPAWYGPA